MAKKKKVNVVKISESKTREKIEKDFDDMCFDMAREIQKHILDKVFKGKCIHVDIVVLQHLIPMLSDYLEDALEEIKKH